MVCWHVLQQRRGSCHGPRNNTVELRWRTRSGAGADLGVVSFVAAPMCLGPSDEHVGWDKGTRGRKQVFVKGLDPKWRQKRSEPKLTGRTNRQHNMEWWILEIRGVSDTTSCVRHPPANRLVRGANIEYQTGCSLPCVGRVAFTWACSGGGRDSAGRAVGRRSDRQAPLRPRLRANQRLLHVMVPLLHA